MKRPSYLNFDYKNYSCKSNIDYQSDPFLYKIAKGEQGVYHIHITNLKPLRSHVRAVHKIYEMFLNYLKKDDFVGANMARKFLQIGLHLGQKDMQIIRVV